MKRSGAYYEIKSYNGAFGLMGTFSTEADALAEINKSYNRALENGYDNRREKWAVVRVEWEKDTEDVCDEYIFLEEKTHRFVTNRAEFSEYDKKFVFLF